MMKDNRMKNLKQYQKKFQRLIRFNGECHCLSDWSKKLGMNKTTLRDRFVAGLSTKEALTKKVRHWGKKRKI